jgi:molybdopterin-guanine dinucleotide biosynthesis adapter protein
LKPTLFGFAGFSGSGKTTLIEGVIPHLVSEGLRVALIKHAHHTFDIDQPGKDSYRHRKAGAFEVLVGSSQRWALMHELNSGSNAEPEPTLDQQLARLSPCDLVIVEGYKRDPIQKIEVHRKAASEQTLLYPNDSYIIAIATDELLDTNLPQIDVNDAQAVALFILGIHAVQ